MIPALVVVAVVQALAIVMLIFQLRSLINPTSTIAPAAAPLEPVEVEHVSAPLSPREQQLAFSESLAVARIAEGVLPSSTRR